MTADEAAAGARSCWPAITAYAAGFSALSILRYHAFSTGRFDLGNMTQAVWATAHGHPLAITNIQGEQVSRLGSHVDPILVAFAPLWWVWPSPSMLLTAQAIAIALGALPVFWLARKHLGSERAGLGFALAYLLYPPSVADARRVPPVALACPLLLFAFWYLDEDRLVPFAIFALLAALTKEEIPLVIAGIGVWYALSRKRYWAGGAIAALGVVVTAVSLGLVMPHFNPNASARVEQRYGDLGDSPAEVLATVFTDPGKVLSTAFDSEGIHYLADLLLPLLLLFAAAPLVLVAAVPELGLNLLSETHTQSSIHHHYTAGLIPPLVAATVLGAARIARGDRNVGPRSRESPSPRRSSRTSCWARSRCGAFSPAASRTRRTPLTSRRMTASRSGRSSSSPTTRWSARRTRSASHLSARRRFLSFPDLEDAEWVAADETQPGLRRPLGSVRDRERPGTAAPEPRLGARLLGGRRARLPSAGAAARRARTEGRRARRRAR